MKTAIIDWKLSGYGNINLIGFHCIGQRHLPRILSLRHNPP